MLSQITLLYLTLGLFVLSVYADKCGPTVLPVPVPVFVPVPMNMYSQYTPKPVCLPIPVHKTPLRLLAKHFTFYYYHSHISSIRALRSIPSVSHYSIFWADNPLRPVRIGNTPAVVWFG